MHTQFIKAMEQRFLNGALRPFHRCIIVLRRFTDAPLKVKMESL